MKNIKKISHHWFGIIGVAVLLILFLFFTENISEGFKQKTKTITCAKGTQQKKITAVQPKCPVGYTQVKSSSPAKK